MNKSLDHTAPNHRLAKTVALAAMALVSLTNLFGVPAAGMSVVLGIGAFLAFKIIEKQSFGACGLGIQSIKEAAKTSIWIWIAAPALINVLVIMLSKLILPDYIAHVMDRSEAMLSTELLPVLAVQIIAFAFAEEVAWRGFFQKRLQSMLPALPAILVTSALFSLGHLTSGSFGIVAYDLVFVWLNSILYGAVFKKTNNVWLSTLSHALANLTAVIILFVL